MTSLLEQIKLAKTNNTFLHIKNFNSDVPSWDNFISNLNYKYNNNYENKENQDRRFFRNNDVKTEIFSQYDKLDAFAHYSYVFKDNKSFFSENFLPGVEKIAEDLYESLEDDKKFIHATAITNFIKHDKEYEIHFDGTDVINWHCIGKIDWRVYDEKDNCSVLQIDPGDLVFIPKGMKHQVIIYEPRASIIFDFFLDLDASI
jgi:hypothetical protein